MLEGSMIRVTDLLKWAGLAPEFPDVPAVRVAANRGTVVHQLSMKIEDLHKKHPSFTGEGNLEIRNFVCTTDPAIRPYLLGVWSFLSEINPVWKMREQQLRDEEILLRGTPDRYGIVQAPCTGFNERRVVVDFKTGPSKPWHRYQLALYSILIERSFPEFKVDERWAVYLTKQGSFKIEIHHSATDITTAWNAINRYRKCQEEGS